MFFHRIFNYEPVSNFIHRIVEFYGSLKKYPTIKTGLDKAEHSFELFQPYFPNIQPYLSTIQKNKVLSTVDQFSCRQLDTIEFGFEKTKEFLDKDVMTNVRDASACLAENGKQLVQDRVVKPVGGPVKDYIDTKVVLITEKFNTPEVQEKIAPIQEFVRDKAYYVHNQIEKNSRFEAIRPHYERALAQVNQVVEKLSGSKQEQSQFQNGSTEYDQEDTFNFTNTDQDNSNIFQNFEVDTSNIPLPNYEEYVLSQDNFTVPTDSKEHEDIEFSQ